MQSFQPLKMPLHFIWQYCDKRSFDSGDSHSKNAELFLVSITDRILVMLVQ